MNVKQLVTIAGVVLAFMGTICQVVSQGADAVAEIKSLKEGVK